MSETFTIYRWDTGAELVSVEAETLKEALGKLVARSANLSSANLRYADLRSANLSSADLRYADLSSANLRYADLSSANLRYADLRYADLSSANLRSANLSSANLRYADLRSANLRYADLHEANGLEFIKHDLWGVLLHAPSEVPALAEALRDGKVDGSVYEGACSCLVGTIANARHCKYDEIPGLVPDSSRPAEVWFMAIAKGDTADKSQVVKLTLDWIAEFEKLIGATSHASR